MDHPARSAINKLLNEDRIRQENVASARALSVADIKAAVVRTLDPNDLLPPIEVSASFFGLNERTRFVWMSWAKEFAVEVVDAEASKLLTAHVQLTNLLSRRFDPEQTGVVEVKAALEFAASRFAPEFDGVSLPTTAPPKRRPELPREQRDAAILAALQRRGIDPLQMPKPPQGNKRWPLREEIRCELGYTIDMILHAWGRLKKDGRMKDA